MNKIRLILTMLVVLVTTGRLSAADYNTCANGHTCDANGFCLTEGCTAKYAVPENYTDGKYLVVNIANGGNLFWLAQYVNGDGSVQKNTPVFVNAKLLNDIDLANVPFTKIGGWNRRYFAGTFDGNGKTIKNFYLKDLTTNNTGLFGYVGNKIDEKTNDNSFKNTIKNFTLKGKMETSGSSAGPVVGAGINLTMEDVVSYVDITHTGTKEGVGGVGGIAGKLSGTIRRCSYHGTLDFLCLNDLVGGLVGTANEAPLKMTSCLFDGKINVANTGKTVTVGGLVGKVSEDCNNDALSYCLSYGEIYVAGNRTMTSTLVGNVNNRNISFTQNYYSSEKNPGLTAITGTNTNVATSNEGGYTDIPASELISDELFGGLDNGDWEAATGSHPLIKQGGDGTHSHNYINGFCTANDAFEAPGKDASGVYDIDNGGKLFWFALHSNENGGNVRAKLSADIDLENREFPGIGVIVNKTTTTPFMGSFQSDKSVYPDACYTISNFSMNLTATSASLTNRGFFNSVSGAAQIRDFVLNGKIVITENVGCENIGTVVGYSNSSSVIIEDVRSNVSITCSSKGKNYGGIMAYGGAQFNRCRYSGIITGKNTGQSNESSVAGILAVASVDGTTIQNTLFDGTITASYADYSAGLVGQCNGKSIDLLCNLVNGKVTGAASNSGAIFGSFSGDIDKWIANYYNTDKVSKAYGTLGSGLDAINDLDIRTTTTNELRDGEGTILFKLNILQNPSTGKAENWTQDNWTIAYPYPSTVGVKCMHKLNGASAFDANGFCTLCDDGYEEPTLTGDNYIVTKGGNLFWLAEKLRAEYQTYSGKNNVEMNIKLGADVSMQGGKKENRSFRGFGAATDDNNYYAFKGTFDGNGKTIRDFYTSLTSVNDKNYRGFFNYLAEGTKVKNFTLEGTIDGSKVASNHVGGIVGHSAATTVTIEDVHSKVALKCSAKGNNYGGIMGDGVATINRCRYSGTASTLVEDLEGIEGGTLQNNIGGIAGEAHGCAITNCLFDGVISSSAPVDNAQTYKYLRMGALVGAVSDGDLTLRNCVALANDHIKLPAGYDASKYKYVGALVGTVASGRTLLAHNNYYLPISGQPAVGTVDGLMPRGLNFVETDASELSYSTRYVIKHLGLRNWKQESGDSYPYPCLVISNCDHSCGFDANGFCQNCALSYEAPTGAGTKDSPYLVSKGGQLFWLAEQSIKNFSLLTDTKTAYTCYVKLTDDVDMLNYNFRGIGIFQDGNHYVAFGGEFDGQGHTIKGFDMLVEGTKDYEKKYRGFVNYSNQTLAIHDFSLEGNVNAQFVASQYIGTVMGYTSNSNILIEDVHSSVNLACASNGTYYGGFCGYLYCASMNRCWYSGTIDAGTLRSRVGGITGCANNDVIANCLFDGTILSQAPVDNGNTMLYLGAIAGIFESNNARIKNCLSVGTISLPGYQASLYKRVGQLVGFVSGGKTLYQSNNYFKEGYDFPAVGTVSGTVSPDATVNTATASQLASGSLVRALSDENWEQNEGDSYPHPSETGSNCTHPSFTANGFCAKCDHGYQKPAQGDGTQANPYVIKNGGQLFWLAEESQKGFTITCGKQKFNCYTVLDGKNKTIDLEGREFPGIGRRYDNNNYITYTGGFNGMDNTIVNFKMTLSSTLQQDKQCRGFFNGLYQAATIRRFTLGSGSDGSKIDCTISGAEWVASISGRIESVVTLEDIHSNVDIVVGTGDNYGGFVGYCSGKINRCWYSGTIDTKNVKKRIGGIAGEAHGNTISNCLFDGTINSSAAADAGTEFKNWTRIGGIVGHIGDSDQKVLNCLSTGTINVQGYTAASLPCIGSLVGYVSPTKSLIQKFNYYVSQSTNGSVLPAFGKIDGSAKPDAYPYATDLTTLADGSGSVLRALGVDNWAQDDFTKAYPHPSRTGYECSHPAHVNGFCSTCGRFLAPEEGDGTQNKPYIIMNAGNLFWLADKSHEGFTTTCGKQKFTCYAKLGDDIDLDSRDFPGIGITHNDNNRICFAGEFDGQGYTIDNFTMTVVGTAGYEMNFRALFSSVDGSATIKNFTIGGFNVDGTPNSFVDASSAAGSTQVASVVGRVYSGTATIEDIHSNVKILCPSTGSNFGGIVGYCNGNINRCWYSGTIEAGTLRQRVAGIVGGMAGGRIDNCLFDGTINSTAPADDGDTMLMMGAMVGYLESASAAIQNCLTVGKFNLPGYDASKYKNVGQFIGRMNTGKTLTQTHNYVLDGSLCGLVLPNIGNVNGATIKPNANFKITTFEALADGKGTVLETLGKNNWSQANYNEGYPHPGNDFEKHQESYVNGFCSVCGHYQKPFGSGTAADPYQISNGGNLFWFAEESRWSSDGNKFFDGGGMKNYKCSARLVADIDLEGRDEEGNLKRNFPGICVGDPEDNAAIKNATSFVGTFDGQGFTIKNFQMTIIGDDDESAIFRGFFNFVGDNAVIKDFTIEGDVDASQVKSQQAGGVAGHVNNTTALIEDVHSKVDIKASETGNNYGGITGWNEGKINRCRYSGTIYAGKNRSSMGGISSAAGNGVYTNCLFDGKLISQAEPDGEKKMKFGGILGTFGTWQQSACNIQNCLSVGTIQIDGYTAAKYAYVGSLVGYIQYQKANRTLTQSNNHIVLNYSDMPLLGKKDNNTSINNTTYVKEVLGTARMTDGTLLSELGVENWKQEENYPVPYKKRVISDDEGTYYIYDVATLKAFRDLVNAGHEKIHGVMTANVNFPAISASDVADPENSKLNFGRPIGSGVEKAYGDRHVFRGTFNGQGYKINNLFQCGDYQCVGLFGDCEGATIQNIGDVTGHAIYSGTKMKIGSAWGAELGSDNDDNMLSLGTVARLEKGGTISHVTSSLNLHSLHKLGSEDSNIAAWGLQDKGMPVCVGGIVGVLSTVDATKPATVEYSTYNGNIGHAESISGHEGCNHVTDCIGGIVGTTDGSLNSVITFSTFTGSINNSNMANGVISGKTSSSSYGTETNHLSCVGGVVGSLTGDVTLSYNSVEGDMNIEASTSNNTYLYAGHEIGLNQADDIINLYNFVPENEGNMSVIGVGNGSITSDATYPGEGIVKVSLEKNGTGKFVAYRLDNYIFDDNGDLTFFPENMKKRVKNEGIKVKIVKYSYERAQKYVKNMMSVCLPFALNESMIPANSKIFRYTKVSVDLDGTNNFRFIRNSQCPAGEPCLVCVYNEAGVLTQADESWRVEVDHKTADKAEEISIFPGNVDKIIYGKYDTEVIGSGFFKVDTKGTGLLTTTEKSVCYPFRCYMTQGFSDSGFVKAMSGLSDFDQDAVEDAEIASQDGQAYDITGRKVDVSHLKRGTIYIVNGKKYIAR